MATMPEMTPERRIEALFERGEERGCLDLSELAELAQELDMADDDLQALHERLEARGIEVVRGAHGLATGLRAEVGDPDGPTIAVLSEYDALPGIGHGCGHNVIATAGLGAFLALATVADRLPGRAGAHRSGGSRRPLPRRRRRSRPAHHGRSPWPRTDGRVPPSCHARHVPGRGWRSRSYA